MGAGNSSRVINTEISEQSIALLLNNTHKNKEDIAAFHAAFLKESPSGKVDQALFAKLFKDLHENDAKKANADKYAQYVFKAFQGEATGLNFSEFVIAFSVTSFGKVEEKIRLAFQIFDLDGNGQIDREELIQVISSLKDLNGIPDSERTGENSPAARADEVMKVLDINHDKSISEEEFLDGCLKAENVRKAIIEPLYN